MPRPFAIAATMFAALVAAFVVAPAAAADRFVGIHIDDISGLDRTDTAPGQGARSALLYGFGAGYDLAAASNIRLGAEVEWQDSTGAQTVAGLRQTVGRALYAGARAGVVVAPRLLAYVKGGYVNGRFFADDVRTYTGNGWRAGIGAEFALSRRSFLKTEYRFSDYGQTLRGQHFVLGGGLRF